MIKGSICGSHVIYFCRN